ncbi:MAG: hypothetical protein U5J78_01265 [Parasphingorhabdus sp.]|nr:hypothetical protein [Parasphingorhabdus sp.]
MNEPKPLASLSSKLLARKGGAMPAMRRQSLGFGAPNMPTHDDLGWNDMGYDVNPDHAANIADVQHHSLPELTPEPVVKPALPEVRKQQDALAEKLAKPVRRKVREKAKSAFTLRLNAHRHLRLRLASAVQGQSAQCIVTDALDQYLQNIPEIEALATRVKNPVG